MVAAALRTTTAVSQAGATSRIASVEIVGDMTRAETTWRAFENAAPLATPYQRFELLDAWQRHVGRSEGARPCIVVARDGSGEPLCLFPLAVTREGGAQVARFMGGKHPTFNMALWQRDFAQAATKADIETIFDALRRAPDGADMLALTQQPRSWRGVANPLLPFADQPSVNPCPRMTMMPGAPPEAVIGSSQRRRLRNKERKLQALPGYRYFQASDDADIARLLEAFFIIKPQRMALAKLPDIFSDEATRAFIRDACNARLANGERAITLHALECDSEVISIFACVADGERFSTMFNTYTISENARYSPGLILLRYMIDHYAALGYTSFDFGVGTDEYKMSFCKEDEPLFDSFIPLTARGRLTAFGLASLAHAKRLVKQNPTLMQMAQLLRGAVRR